MPQMNAQQAAAARDAQNRAFMRYSYVYPVLANAQNGTTYTPGGNAIAFDAPVIEGGYLVGVTVRHTLKFTYTAATSSPSVTVNAGGPWNASSLQVIFGNQQIAPMSGYVAEKLLKILGGYNRMYTGQVIGEQNSDIQAKIYDVPAIAGGSNTWQFDTDYPLNMLHPESPWGILPIDGTGTKVTLNVIPPTSFTGADPLQNVVSTNGTIAVSGSSVQVILWVRDYRSFNNRGVYAPILGAGNGLPPVPTVQFIKPQELNPLTSGSMVYRRLDNPYEFAKVFSIVIDGQSSTKFSQADNITAFEIDRADNDASVLRKWDSTNGDMTNYYKFVRDRTGQDLDTGVLFYDATLENIVDPSLRTGSSYLNVLGNNNYGVSPGFPAARLGYTVSTVSSANSITPRVVTYGVIINRDGIQLA